MPSLAAIPLPSTLWLQHITCVLIFAVITALLIIYTRRTSNPTQRRRTEITLAILGFLTSFTVNLWWFWPTRFFIQKSLPLQLCDIVGIIAPLSLLTRWRPLRALLHFWGFGLCSQWVFTPVTKTGPETPEFWISFILHASILGTAAFDVFAFNFRPSWRDWRTAIFIGAIYVAAMIPLNIALGSNYGYVGDTIPGMPTLIDRLGPWPLRILWIVLLGTAAVTLVKLAGSCLRRPG